MLFIKYIGMEVIKLPSTSPANAKYDLVKIHLPDFSLRQIANSVQCFRMKEILTNTWEVIALDKRLQSLEEKESQNYIFDCSLQEFEEIWFDYFDLGRDYGKIKWISKRPAIRI